MKATKYTAFLFMFLMEARGRSMIDKMCQLIWGEIVGTWCTYHAIKFRASNTISGLVKFEVTSPTWLVNDFVKVEPCYYQNIINEL